VFWPLLRVSSGSWLINFTPRRSIYVYFVLASEPPTTITLSPPRVTSKCSLRWIYEYITVLDEDCHVCRSLDKVRKTVCEGACGNSSETSPVTFLIPRQYEEDEEVLKLQLRYTLFTTNRHSLFTRHHEVYQEVSSYY